MKFNIGVSQDRKKNRKALHDAVVRVDCSILKQCFLVFMRYSTLESKEELQRVRVALRYLQTKRVFHYWSAFSAAKKGLSEKGKEIAKLREHREKRDRMLMWVDEMALNERGRLLKSHTHKRILQRAVLALKKNLDVNSILRLCLKKRYFNARKECLLSLRAYKDK